MGHNYDRHHSHRHGGRGRGSGRHKKKEEQEVIDVPPPPPPLPQSPPPVQQPVPTTTEWSAVYTDPSGACNYQAQRQSDGTWKYNIIGRDAVKAEQVSAPPAPLPPAPPAAAYPAYAEPAHEEDYGAVYQEPPAPHHPNRHGRGHRHGHGSRHGSRHGGAASTVVSSTGSKREIRLILPRDMPVEIMAPNSSHGSHMSVYSDASSGRKVEDWLGGRRHHY